MCSRDEGEQSSLGRAGRKRTRHWCCGCDLVMKDKTFCFTLVLSYSLLMFVVLQILDSARLNGFAMVFSDKASSLVNQRLPGDRHGLDSHLLHM
jgi:hypothetical protein